MGDRDNGPITVLIIDDDEGDRLHAVRCIHQSGLECTLLEASDVAPALADYGHLPVDLILLDYNLPNGDSLSALQMLQEKWPASASVLTTGEGSDVLVAKAFRAGICDYVSKLDFSARTIRRVIETGVKARRLELQLHAQTEELNLFAHVLAHDVKAPLRAIRNFSDWASESLNEGDTTATQKELTYIGESAARLDALVDSLTAHLDVKRASEFVPVDAGSLAKQAVQNLRLEIIERGAKVEIEPLPMVLADQRQIIQLFQNLIANGLKFSEAETPTVTITAPLIGGDVHTICVADNGIGIAPDYAKKIFKPFIRLHGPDEFAGSGLGLATCEKIVSRHGGSIWCKPGPRKGTCFYFSLCAVNTVRSIA